MKYPITVAGTGLFALDVLLDAEQNLLHAAPGGTAGNVLSILGAFGFKVIPIGEIGDDIPAKLIRQEFSHYNTDTTLLQSVDYKDTPVVFQHQLHQHLQGATHKFSFTCPRCGSTKAPYLQGGESLVDKALRGFPEVDIFFLDRPSELGCLLAEAYSHLGATVVFEPSSGIGSSNLFTRALKSADIVKYASDRLSGLDAFELDLKPNAIEIQTLGSKGLRYRVPTNDKQWTTSETFIVKSVVDTSGAGDWCTAGLLFSLCNTGRYNTRETNLDRIGDALSFGQALSALNCFQPGARGLMNSYSSSAILELAASLSKDSTADILFGGFDDSTTSSTPAYQDVGVNPFSANTLLTNASSFNSRIESYCCDA